MSEITVSWIGAIDGNPDHESKSVRSVINYVRNHGIWARVRWFDGAILD